jgi:hypothetical protein
MTQLFRYVTVRGDGLNEFSPNQRTFVSRDKLALARIMMMDPAENKSKLQTTRLMLVMRSADDVNTVEKVVLTSDLVIVLDEIFSPWTHHKRLTAAIDGPGEKISLVEYMKQENPTLYTYWKEERPVIRHSPTTDASSSSSAGGVGGAGVGASKPDYSAFPSLVEDA